MYVDALMDVCISVCMCACKCVHTHVCESLCVALRMAAPAFRSRFLFGDFSGSSHVSDLQIGTPVASLPGAWCVRVSAGIGWPDVSIL